MTKHPTNAQKLRAIAKAMENDPIMQSVIMAALAHGVAAFDEMSTPPLFTEESWRNGLARANKVVFEIAFPR